jgi:hypothetical protein
VANRARDELRYQIRGFVEQFVVGFGAQAPVGVDAPRYESARGWPRRCSKHPGAENRRSATPAASEVMEVHR